jgi:hypothetical protein
MPHRTLSVAFGIVGLLAVLGLLLARVDLARAARSGPAWRRRLVGAGLALLSVLGLQTATAGPRPESKAAAAPAPARPIASALTATAEWKRIQQIWTEAEAIGSGARGAYPFDEAGKKRTLAALVAAGKDVDALLRAGKLGAAEAGLLQKELQRLTLGVRAMRPKDMMRATCYEPMPYTRGRESLKRLQDRLPLVEKLAAARRIDAAVLDKVLRQIENDLDTIEGPAGHDLTTSGNRAQAQQLAKKARAHIAKIRALAKGAGK